MSITKTDVLNTVIKITRDTGQGLTGIVSLNSPEYAKYLDILEKEGKIEKYTIYNNYLANDIWYLPKGIYSVWSDKNYMKSLSYIRKYLKIESLNDVKGVLDNKEFNNYVSEYNNWINEHKEKLKEIINLKTTDEDLSSDEHDSDIDINFEVFKSRKMV